MTKSRRIILNTLATYGRSVFALLLGIFSSRWLLQGLGARDLGLQCTVGSLIAAIIILETVMQTAVARFYAYAIGQAEKMSDDEGADEVCRWFNVVFFIYTILPTIVLGIGYPIGLYAVQNWLTIPPERMGACIYVFRCSMIATFISMVSVPFIAMYQARQEIVELSIYGVLRAIINFFFTYSLLYVACDRLKYSGFFGAGVTVCILSVQMGRAYFKFRECRVRMSYILDWGRLRQIFSYFFWEIFSCVGNMTRQQGATIVVNKCFGPVVNAGWSIANTLSNHATALSGALSGALVPAVTVEAGAGEREKMIRLAFRTSKLSVLLILMFCVPLIAEIDEVLRLWLVTPPPYTAMLCTCILVAHVIDKMALGHHVAIAACGKIGLYHGIVGTTFLFSIPIAIGFIVLGLGPLSVGLMYITCYVIISLERVVLARKLVRMSIRCFINNIFIPVVVVGVLGFAVSRCISGVFTASFIRIIYTTVVSLITMGIVTWFLVLDTDERTYIKSALRSRLSHR